MTPRPIPRIHRATTLRLNGSPGEAISLDGFIEEARSEFVADDLNQLRGLLDNAEAKLAMPQAQHHHDLQEGVRQLIKIIISPEALAARDPLPKHIAEAGIALSYFLKGIDLIPDTLPEIGLTDDARIVALVLDRNPELR